MKTNWRLRHVSICLGLSTIMCVPGLSQAGTGEAETRTARRLATIAAQPFSPSAARPAPHRGFADLREPKTIAAQPFPPSAARPAPHRGFADLPEPKTPAFVSNEVLVQFSPRATALARNEIIGDVGAHVARRLSTPGLRLLDLGYRESVLDAVERLEKDPAVEFAEPNYRYSLAAAPNDPLFSKLWGLSNTGQSIEGVTGTADADIDAPEAWDLTTGDSSVRVAVVDSGVAVQHPDLAPNMLPGWDFIENDADPQDENGHGTHVAATIGARGNDGFGVAGVSWAVGIIPVRVFGGHIGNTADIVSGINYAVHQGADIVNLSLGGSSPSQAMAQAISSAPNVLFVVSAGNGGDDGVGDNNDSAPYFPCNYSSANVVCVAATDQSDRLGGFSNYGAQSVDIAAPGTNILSAAPASAVAFASNFEESVLPWSSGGTSAWGLEEDYEGYFASDSPNSPYGNNADSWIDAGPFNLTGKRGCSVAFWLYLDTEFERDALLVEGTTDGTNYEMLAGWTGWSESWVPLSVDMSAYDGRSAVGLSFRLVSDESITGDGAYVDDVFVNCDSAAYGSSSVAVKQGTSMAAPHVAGAAALLLAAKQTASVSELRQALLSGVDRRASLSTKVVTGGRLNVANSLRSIAPPTTPIPTLTPTSTPTPTASPAPPATPTASPTTTPSSTATPSSSPTPSASPTPPPDTLAPYIDGVSDRPDPFSPNGDGRKDKTTISWSVSESIPLASVAIYKGSTLIKSFGEAALDPGGWFVKWAGRSDAGVKVKNGAYTYVIRVEDAAGNVREARGQTTVAR